jgi:hypothetical protein
MPRQRLDLAVFLPKGSEGGQYEMQILDSEKKGARASAITCRFSQ